MQSGKKTEQNEKKKESLFCYDIYLKTNHVSTCDIQNKKKKKEVDNL
jgi:hypothetical protein